MLNPILSLERKLEAIALIAGLACVLSLGAGCTGTETTASGSTESIETEFTFNEDIVFTPQDDVAANEACIGAEDGSPCEDGDLCTIEDICIGGTCISGGPRSCTEEGTCRHGTCEPDQGCIYVDADDGRPCQMNCFTESACKAGVCVEDESTEILCPAPENDCVEQLLCDRDTGQCSITEYKEADTACNTDDNVCSVEVCDGKGTCQPTDTLEDCKDKQLSNPCWTYSCTPKTGCVPTHFVEGLSCDDGNSCTINDACAVSNVGQKTCLGVPVALDDGNPCTNDSCADGVVVHEPVDGVPCSPNDGCSDTGMCSEGQCKPDLVCECTHDGDCAQPDSLCGGVVTCNTSVAGGKCEIVAGTPVICEPTDEACYVNACDPSSGVCVLELAPDGATCDDGDTCTGLDTCVEGACTGGIPVVCDDGAFCNGEETCDKVLGCVSGPSPSIGDGVSCTVDACDEETDTITHFANSGLCTDQLFCNGEETCDLTLGCVDGAPPETEDGDSCTVGSCDEELDLVLQSSIACGFTLVGQVLSDGGGASTTTTGSTLMSSIGAPRFSGTSSNGSFILRAGLPKGGN